MTTNKSILLYTSIYSHCRTIEVRSQNSNSHYITSHNTNSQSRLSKIPSLKMSTPTMTIIKKISYTIKRCSLLHYNSIYNNSSPTTYIQYLLKYPCKCVECLHFLSSSLFHPNYYLFCFDSTEFGM